MLLLEIFHVENRRFNSCEFHRTNQIYFYIIVRFQSIYFTKFLDRLFNPKKQWALNRINSHIILNSCATYVDIKPNCWRIKIYCDLSWWFCYELEAANWPIWSIVEVVDGLSAVGCLVDAGYLIWVYLVQECL